ncbi:hypothetical protein [Sinomicrobium sp.]
MNTAAAVAVVAATTSNAAIQAQEERKCREFMKGFDSYAATVSEQKYYADCVDMIHPDPATGAEVLLIKIILVCALIGVVVGAIRGWFIREFGIFDVFLFGLVGGLVGAFIPAFIMGCIFAIAFILS